MAEELTPEQAHSIAVEGYIYLYPLITMEISRRQLCQGAADAQPGRGPMGMFHHIRTFPDADFKAVVRPNFDTLYSSAWLDLSTEPYVVSAPESAGRYFLLPLLDMWTDVFAAPGTRTSGSAAVSLALCAPGWDGELPDGLQRVDAPTPTVWIVGRTQTNGPADYAAVNTFQDGLAVTPLSVWNGGPAVEPQVIDNPEWDTVTPPLDIVNAMSAAEYFALGAELMGVHPPHATDWGVVTRLRRLGVVAGRPFDLAALPPAIQDAFAGAAKDGLAGIQREFATIAPPVNGWMELTETIGVYGNAYTKRAAVTMVGLGANQPEDAIYPVLQSDADGHPIDGDESYVIHFDADTLPPVDAFWSVTMYDAHGFQVANELDRFAIGDRDALEFNADGSLDLYLQPANPGPELVSNWLPSVPGPAGVTLRLYLPRQSVLTRDWTPPAVRKVS